MKKTVFALAAALWACAAPAPEQAAWQVLENRHFVLYGALPEAEARAALIGLERFRAAVEAAVGIRPPREPKLRVMLFASPRAAGGLLEAGWAAGFVANLSDGDVVVTSRASPGLERLYIEVVLSGRSPYWYAQGMADLLSTLRVEGDTATIGVPPKGYGRARRRSQSKGEDSEKDDVTGLTLVTDESYKSGVADRRREHWLLAHYLLLASRERAEDLREYLRLWQLGVASPEAFERAVGRSADELYAGEVARYAQRGFQARTMALSRFEPDEELRLRATDPGEVRRLLSAVRGWQARRDPPPKRSR